MHDCIQIFMHSSVFHFFVMTGKEKEISLMGCVSVIFGLTGMFFGGMYIDKTHRYRFISVLDFLLCAATFAGNSLSLFSYLTSLNIGPPFIILVWGR